MTVYPSGYQQPDRSASNPGGLNLDCMAVDGKYGNPSNSGARDANSIGDNDTIYYYKYTADNHTLDGQGAAWDSAKEIGTRLESTVAAIHVPDSESGTVAFDLFDSQTGTNFGSSIKVQRYGYLRMYDFHIELPQIDLASRNTKETWVQFAHLFDDLQPPIEGCVGGIFQEIPYFDHGNHWREGKYPWPNPSLTPPQDTARFVEDIVDTFVNESTADTLDQYPTTF